jgi:hypothetical protein
MMTDLIGLADDISDDDCAICGKSKSQHHTGSGYGVCQIYPCFVSKRTMFERLAHDALQAHATKETHDGTE